MIVISFVCFFWMHNTRDICNNIQEVWLLKRQLTCVIINSKVLPRITKAQWNNAVGYLEAGEWQSVTRQEYHRKTLASTTTTWNNTWSSSVWWSRVTTFAKGHLSSRVQHLQHLQGPWTVSDQTISSRLYEAVFHQRRPKRGPILTRHQQQRRQWCVNYTGQKKKRITKN